MANFIGQPSELLIRILGHLRDRRIDLFDPVATRDLQNVRLVSHRMSAIATPMLFENMVYDLKFYRDEDVNRLTSFAQSNPKLVEYVHRLQVKMPPYMDEEWMYFTTWSIRRLNGCTTKSNHWTDAQASKVHGVFRQFFKSWHEEQIWAFQMISQHNSAMQNITKVLPSLRHIENGLSTRCERKIAEIDHKFFVDEGINIPQGWVPPGRHQNTKVFRIVLSNMTETINSLKLREIAFGDTPKAAMIPWYLQHLDLELLTQVTWKDRFSNPRRKMCLDTASEEGNVKPSGLWHQSLRRLRQLKTLRLRILLKGGLATDYEFLEGEDPDFRLLYIDDLLVDPNNPEDDCFFPELTSLELVDCTLRISGLLRIAEKHQTRLRELVFTRVTFAPKYSQTCCEIADMCKGALPGLKYLRLAKVVTSPPRDIQRRSFVQDFDGRFKTEDWRSGLEDAMTYEWTRGET